MQTLESPPFECTRLYMSDARHLKKKKQSKYLFIAILKQTKKTPSFHHLEVDTDADRK